MPPVASGVVSPPTDTARAGTTVIGPTADAPGRAPIPPLSAPLLFVPVGPGRFVSLRAFGAAGAGPRPAPALASGNAGPTLAASRRLLLLAPAPPPLPGPLSSIETT